MENQPDPTVQNLLQQVNNPRAASQHIGQGVLMAFSYSFWKNDPYPLIIVSRVEYGKMIWGVNLHYLTFPYIKNLLSTQCNNPSFSYASIKGQNYIVNAYRSYKWAGIRQVRILDCSFLLTVMGLVRSFDPAEIEIIRRQIQEQVRQQINPTTRDIITPKPVQTAAPPVTQAAPMVPQTPTVTQVGQNQAGFGSPTTPGL